MWSREFWLASGERALRTFAQTLAAVIGAGSLSLLSIGSWPDALATAGMAALLSALTSVASAGLLTNGGPSIGGTEVLTPTPTPQEVPPEMEDDVLP